MGKIELISFSDNASNYELLNKWCSNRNVYEWFEQRILSYDEIVAKYQKKLKEGKQKLYLINCDDKLIGLFQLYKYDDTVFDILKGYKNIYEYDIFIGEDDYLNKGIGSQVVKVIDDFIFNNYLADAIILRPFKRNVRAIKCYQKNNYHIVYEYDGKDTLGNDEPIVMLINDNK